MAHLIWVQLIKAYLASGARTSSWLRTGHIWGVWASFSQRSLHTVTVLGRVFAVATSHFPWGRRLRNVERHWPLLGFFLTSLCEACLPSWLGCSDAALIPDFTQTSRAFDVTQWSEGGLFICINHTDWTEPLGAYQLSVSWNLPSVSSHGPDVILASSCFNSWGALSHLEHRIKT